MGIDGMQTEGHGRRLCETQAQMNGGKQCWWRGRFAWTGVLQGVNSKKEEEGRPRRQD